MKLVAVYIKEYKAIKDAFIPISNSFSVRRINNELEINSKERFSEYYSGYQISLLLGKNGVGKTTILDFIQGIFGGGVGEGCCIFHIDGRYEIYSNALINVSVKADLDIVYFDECEKVSVAVVNNIFDISSFSLSERRKGYKNIIVKTDTEIAKLGKLRSLLDNIKTQVSFIDSNSDFLKSIGNPNPQYLFSLFRPNKKRFDDAIKECCDEHILLLEEELNFFYANVEGEGKKENNLIRKKDEIGYFDEQISHKIQQHIENVSQYIFNASHYKDFPSDNDLVWYFQKFFLSDLLWDFSNSLYKEKSDVCYLYVSFMIRSFNDLAVFQVESDEDDVYFPKGFDRDNDVVYDFYELMKRASTYFLHVALDIEEEKVTIKNSTSGIYFSSNKPSFIASASNNFSMLNSYLNKKVKFGWTGFSSGEFAMIKLYSRVYNSVEELKKRGYEKIILLIDEVDLYLHPEWQRTFLKRTIAFLENIISSKNIHLILSTHSPIIASDFLSGDIFIVRKSNGKVVVGESEIGFGTGINGLYLNSFSLSSSIGEYSRHHLKQLFKHSQLGELREFDLKLINEIGDKEIREKLSHQVSNNDSH